jgi:hypothetical protein
VKPTKGGPPAIAFMSLKVCVSLGTCSHSLTCQAIPDTSSKVDSGSETDSKHTNVQRLRIIAPLFLAIGLGACSFAAYLYTNTREFVAKGEHARAVVVALRHSSSSGYSPVVDFKTAAGTKVEFIGRNGSSPPSFDKGEQIEVIYRPENPSSAKINTFMELWAAPLFLTLFGTIFSAFGFACVFVVWRRRHTGRQCPNSRPGGGWPT